MVRYTFPYPAPDWTSKRLTTHSNTESVRRDQWCRLELPVSVKPQGGRLLSTKEQGIGRENRVWSSKSDLFHTSDCASAARISTDNRRTGTAPENLEPHDCVLEEQAASATSHKPPTAVNMPVHHPIASPALAARPDYSHHEGTMTAPAQRQDLNPYCHCAQCKCSPPCTCGLRKTASNSTIEWDAGEQLLRHTVTEVYRPDPTRVAQQGATSHQQAVNTCAPAVPVVSARPRVSVDDAVNQSLDKGAQQQHLLASYHQSADQHAGHHAPASVREAMHKGHRITLKTSNEVLIDGKPLDVHISVADDGSVHCHSVPNYSTASSINLLKVLIDAFPDDYPPLE